MAVQNWHGGKILMVWLIAAVLGVAAFMVVLNLPYAYTRGFLPVGPFLFGFWAVLFFGCVGLTWRWLSGRER